MLGELDTGESFPLSGCEYPPVTCCGDDGVTREALRPYPVTCGEAGGAMTREALLRVAGETGSPFATLGLRFLTGDVLGRAALSPSSLEKAYEDSLLLLLLLYDEVVLVAFVTYDVRVLELLSEGP